MLDQSELRYSVDVCKWGSTLRELPELEGVVD